MPLTRKLPNCPACGLDELWYSNHVYGYSLRCYYCGWDSGEQNKSKSIVAVVNAATIGIVRRKLTGTTPGEG